MNKTYHRRVFGGKDAAFKGIDQGKGSVVPGALEMALNATFDDNVFKTRLGQGIVDSGTTGVIRCARHTIGFVTIMAGTSLIVEST